MCHPHVPWPQLLPTVHLGLRMAYKEDLHASPTELLYGTTNSRRLFNHPGQPSRPTLLRKGGHVKARHFIHKDLQDP